VIAPYDHAALWNKAKVFINRAMDPGDLRSFDEQALWSSAALELLGKAALARVSPLLIAEPTEEGLNILIAAGLIDGPARFSSVSASTIFKRCERAFRPFVARDARRFADARNEYLHGSGLGFTALPPEAWWPKFWALASILVTAQDCQLNDFVGDQRTEIIEAYLVLNKKNVEHRVEALISRAKQRLMLAKSGTLPAKIQLEWGNATDLTAGHSYSAPAQCPACGSPGMAEGDDNSDMEYQYDGGYGDEEQGWVWATVTVPVDYFSCPTCRLVLDGYELIEQSGMAETFTVIDDDPPREPEYGND
jgi:hypothetical protein